MNVVFISPHFPPQFYLFCAALKSMGVNVLGLGDGPAHELRDELRWALTEYVGVPGLFQYDQAYRAFAGLASRHGRIHRVDSLNEHWLGLEAQLREDFNIPGPHSEEIRRMRSKSAMKETFRAAGIPVAEGELFTTPEALRAFAARHGYPFILKPDTGVGAASQYKIDDAAELEDVLKQPLTGYFAETFVVGELKSFDGLTDKDGRVVFWTGHGNGAGVMELVTQQLDCLFYSLRDIPPELERLGRRAVAAFNLRERFFHCEFFRRPDGEWCALEINFRPPGGFTTDMMNYSANIDIYQLWARVIAGDDVTDFKFDRRFHAAHLGRRYGRTYKHSHEQVLALLGDRLMYFREIPRAFAAAMGDMIYLVRTSSEAELLELAAFIHQRA